MGYTTTPGVQGICPTGWHLPTDAEWTGLTTYVNSQTAYRCNSTASYIAKSLAANEYWHSSLNTCAIGNDLSANNATNFTGLPGGFGSTGGAFLGRHDFGYWWSSTEKSTTQAWNRILYYDFEFETRGNNNKGDGLSVRCIKDDVRTEVD